MKKWLLGFVVALCLVGNARAQFAVIDVAAIVQLVQQLRALEQQLEQAKAEFDSITGGRGMERLLEGTVRNYLPSNWGELLGSLEGAQDAYGALSAGLRVLLEANAVLTEDELAEIPEAQRAELIAARRSTAALQALAREALAATSARFESLQALIDAIAGAEDQKAILELQARIGAEHDMLLNEQTKLELLDRGLKAEETLRVQRAREHALQSVGSLRALPAMGL